MSNTMNRPTFTRHSANRIPVPARQPVEGLEPRTLLSGTATQPWMLNYSGVPNAVVVQPNSGGKIIAGGYTGGSTTDAPTPHLDFALTRYNADGSVDASYGVN